LATDIVSANRHESAGQAFGILRPVRAKLPSSSDLRRYVGGARHEASERVVLHAPAGDSVGWALNVSRGGLRVVVEDGVVVGQEFEVAIGSDDAEDRNVRRGRVVWVRAEADGQIVGIEFVEATRPDA
jgi:hypothetical protein